MRRKITLFTLAVLLASSLFAAGKIFPYPYVQEDLPNGLRLITIATDWADHYSTAASYLRLNDILPPTAQPKK